MQPQDQTLGPIQQIRRFPVKSILGESLQKVEIDQRGLVGDRLWAVRHPNGRLGSGKTTKKRLQQMDGLFRFQARHEGADILVTMPDGAVYPITHDALDDVLSQWLEMPVSLVHEEATPHFDDGPISLITTSALRALSQQVGDSIDARRFRANLLIESDQIGYIEDQWVNRQIAIGTHVTLRVVAPLRRCVMITNAQQELQKDNRVLKTLGSHHDTLFGVWAEVEKGGTVAIGDMAMLR